MACEIVTTDRAVFALWGKPEAEDFNKVLAALQTVFKQSGKAALYVTRVPVDAPAPSPEVRKHLDTLMPKFVDLCSTYHVILEGQGFLAALKRGVLTSLFQIRWRRGTFFVHATSNEVALSLPSQDQVRAAEILRAAQRKGYLSGSGPAGMSASA